MQILGVLSLLLSVLSMFLYYISLDVVAAWVCGLGLLMLCLSLCLAIWEIHISVKALGIHLKDLRERIVLTPEDD